MNSHAPLWLITGASGMLGRDMQDVLATHGVNAVALSREQLDITDADAAARAVEGATVVVNCAAYTDVDGAEADADGAFAINATGPEVLAQACADAGATLVHFSTDYVFSGEATEPYSEDARTNPRSVYGKSKEAGEQAVLASAAHAYVVRTAWLYGAHGGCFPRTIARVGEDKGALRVVSDQVGQPTWTVDLADFTWRLIAAQAAPGIYHGTSAGHVSWYEFAREVTASAGLGDIVSPSTTTEFPRPVPRPAWSVLGHDAAANAGVESIGPWRERWLAAAATVLA